ncbi:glycine cleavage system protein GcvH [Alloalcanivorax xenomutans]|jgi:glycine cleavage system H protein|uniref:glycine cleavage system protein GcvH n=1 Tax=Alloalcanivorax xenomutans TaxID=1094342 RepID=UPI0003B89054|nr:glycine cleavage system protein GcvH [Alloalcanivorax xenomutans]ERS10735.1 glycine cleavage system protein H [Alcanivorax sp. PN-3]KYZ85098.1 glycine cleavage system protein H [Alcanivorax sp. KX64203]MBA4723104.1 glycine cleavage system protein GcvH [Alcanivorax sp.]ARB44232.1 glycine cleavage system protein H [Alloalcanivorax xenomutans]PHS70088.1 MAG: glycine cleavage system protein H [Alcanivorax sp.]|tara:strand:- start:755 stop:1141 length:387 start_codon:yes stop_codon:yes gene_type:complete|eukprot:gnl/TRDRNA2_/TRDRNA2_74811_c0_seq1.p2 gnl/TRDRNA2_/TRDRNA2_74811_c0~~gnl/TRDRNA2_/TRDRNA2_74811_c0_seq1.p2  ORF type:complete len:129 (-),score=24.07 gnl/TRDRNA2_/TRDRNA2_74811_c0_seq1:85-471(-)
MSEIPAELRYRTSHEWVRVEDDVAVVGITDHAQDAMGDLVYVELPEVGQVLATGEEAGVVESVKAASDIYAPVSGEIVAVNDALEDEPELVNNEPYGNGWLFKIKMADSGELKEMLTADQYQEQLDSE